MGKKLDSLFGRNMNSSTSKLKPLVNLALSRIAVLKSQRQARSSLARSDTLQLLKLAHHDRALLRVEQVIKEQNMIDVLVMIEGYCNLVIERVNLIEQERVCPDELKEAISSLLYASTRCGEFPELQEMRAFFTSRYGKEFVARATELRNNCGVNVKMIQKLSTRQPILEDRFKVLKEIASDNGIVLQMEEPSPKKTEEKLEEEHKQDQSKSNPSANCSGAKLGGGSDMLNDEIERVEGFSDSMVGKRKYKDVADAAQAAFESAAYAAAAARAAVELSRSGFNDSDGPNSPSPRRRQVPDTREQMQFELQTGEEKDSSEIEEVPSVVLRVENIHPNENYQSDSEDDEIPNEIDEIKSVAKDEVFNQNENEWEPKRAVSALSTNSEENILKETTNLPDVGSQPKTSESKIVFDDSDDETKIDHGKMQKPRLFSRERWSSRKSKADKKQEMSEAGGGKFFHPSPKHFFFRSRAAMNA